VVIHSVQVRSKSILAVHHRCAESTSQTEAQASSKDWVAVQGEGAAAVVVDVVIV
jgi:hypothetical protein